MGVIHPFHNQEIEHLQVIVEHVNRYNRALCKKTCDPAGANIQRSFEDFRVELGLPELLTDWNYEFIKSSITPCWLKTVLKYCDQKWYIPL